MNSFALKILLILSAAVFSSGCAGHFQQWINNDYKVGPNYKRPAAQVADVYIDADDPRVVSDETDHRLWWQVFNDPILDELIQTAYDQNLSLRSAAHRVIEARAQLGFARGNLFPQQQGAFFDYQRVQISKATQPNRNLASLPPPFSAVSPKRSFSFWDLGFDAAWELDIWGRFRCAVESANANLNATVEDYDAVLVTLVADVAATYIEIRTLQQQLFFLRKNVKVQTDSFDLATFRWKNGATSELDAQQAKSNLAFTESAVPVLESDLRQARNRLCILLGMPPHELDYLLGDSEPSEDRSTIPNTPAEVVVGVPADLLRRRPDVRAAERRVAAQSALIGVAAADLFPSFSLLGSIGLEAEEFSDLFSGKSVAGVLGAPAIRWPILNYGRIRNNINVQDARFQQLATEYEQAVLRANQEVEDALVAFLKSQQQSRSLAESAAATARSVELASIQYREGAIDFNRLFTLEGSLAEQQNRLAAAQGSVAVNLVRVYKALGGGWEIRLTPSSEMIAEHVATPSPQPVDENSNEESVDQNDQALELPNGDAAWANPLREFQAGIESRRKSGMRLRR